MVTICTANRYRHETDESDTRSYRAPADKTDNDKTDATILQVVLGGWEGGGAGIRAGGVDGWFGGVNLLF
jgi:hypothetical protein